MNENRLLSRITLVTSLGDFISLFAVLKLIHDQTGSLLLAAYAVPIKSLAVALGGFTIPYCFSKYPLRSILVWTQLISAVLLAGLAAHSLLHLSAIAILAILFLETLLKQYFDSARESYSKSLASTTQQRTLQAELMQNFYGAQFIGPIVSFILLKIARIEFAFVLDAISFFIAGLFALRLQNHGTVSSASYSIFAPLKYLGKNFALLQNFLLRSIGYWIPVGIFNFLLFSVVQDHYKLDIIASAWLYSAIGLGSGASALALRSKRKEFSMIRRLTDAKVAALALFLLAVTRVAFLEVPAFWIGIVVVMIGGICNGANAVASQSLRRKLTTNEQFPEIVGLELIFGKITDWLVATLAVIFISSGKGTYQDGILLSAVSLAVLSIAHLYGPISTFEFSMSGDTDG